jgi:hypothetical protein
MFEVSLGVYCKDKELVESKHPFSEYLDALKFLQGFSSFVQKQDTLFLSYGFLTQETKYVRILLAQFEGSVLKTHLEPYTPGCILN